MQLYKVKSGAVVLNDGNYFLVTENWDQLVLHEPLFDYLSMEIKKRKANKELVQLIDQELLAPIGVQEVWAAGVTWLRSREARMEESRKSGGSSFYDLVYEADRPELFFKAMASRVAGHGDIVNIRRDSTWNVPEPELTLFVGRSGTIQGYTIGNDMSSRSIEGENPLYLPQAKTYQWSASLGPCLMLTQDPISPNTIIGMEILRNAKIVYSDSVAISRMKRKHSELVDYLFRECDFPSGCFLMTGTCLVPANDFTLEVGDRIEIQIDGIGLLSNTVGVKSERQS
jgi:2-dehydro-3-deoxy-D-arabinonate dehydratase